MELGFFICSYLMLFICVIFLILMITKNNGSIKITQYRNVLITFGIILICFSFFFVPNSNIRWDLVEHYEEVNAMRGHDFSYALKNSWYSGYYYIAIIYDFLISRLPNNQLMPVIPILLDYGIFMYIHFDRIKAQNEDVVKVSDSLYIFFTWLCIFGLKLAISGLRCVVACTITSLAIYLGCKNKKYIWLSILLFVIAMLIHSFVLVVPIVLLISKVRHKFIIPILMILFDLFGLNALDKLSVFTEQGYLNFTIGRAIRYWNSYSPYAVYNRSGLGFLFMYFGMIVIVAMLFLLLSGNDLYIHDSTNETNGHIFNYTKALIYFSVGMCFNYLFIERTMYLISSALVMFLPIKLKNDWREKIWPVIFLIVLVFVFYNNDVVAFIANYR
jgi:uncharacterized membrane protein YccF (DUF307 family)